MFCLTVLNHLVEEPFCVSETGIEKFYAQEGDITIFCRKIVVSQYRKTSQGNPSVFHETSGIQKLMDRRGEIGREYQDFPSKSFLSQSAAKTRRGILLCCVSENFG